MAHQKPTSKFVHDLHADLLSGGNALLSAISKKKSITFTGDKLKQVLKNVCHRSVLGKVSSSLMSFNGTFLDIDEHGLILDNRLMHLDDVRQLRNRELTVFFPYRKTLLKGSVRLVGLTTFKSIRALRFSVPEKLVSDEKRGVKRISTLPSSELTFHSPDLRFFTGRIHDASPSGFAIIIRDAHSYDDEYLIKGKRYQGEATLGVEFKLSFQIEIRHVHRLAKTGSLIGTYKVGVKIVKLLPQAQERLNAWLLQCHSADVESDGGPSDSRPANTAPVAAKGNTILVIGPETIDLEFWYHCLGRKFEVMTCDDNIANIRDTLNTAPTLLLVYLDPNNPAKASFTRKFCATLNNRFPLMFFSDEPDTKKQQTLAGNIPNLGFLDTSERKILTKFRHVDEVMGQLNE